MRSQKDRINTPTLFNRVVIRAIPMMLVVAALVFAPVGTAYAAERILFPDDESPGPPYYARVEGPHLNSVLAVSTDEWAAIVFYRSPACVPDTFNLLDFFDVPGAFFCGLTVDGFMIWRNGPPPIDNAPMAIHSQGLGAVPIWFVKVEELQAAVADNMLTVPELWSLPSLRIGSADFFVEELHPTGGAQQPFLMMKARGIVDDGNASFQLQHSRTRGGVRTSIRFTD